VYAASLFYIAFPGYAASGHDLFCFLTMQILHVQRLSISSAWLAKIFQLPPVIT